jgi:hypothetical protein
MEVGGPIVERYLYESYRPATARIQREHGILTGMSTSDGATISGAGSLHGLWSGSAFHIFALRSSDVTERISPQDPTR